MRRVLLSLFAASLLLVAGRAEAARIVVVIDGLHSAKGDVYVALYSKPDEFPDGDYSDRHTKVRASTGPITVIFDDLRPGLYAVGAYHDENANGKFDTNFIGYPAEGYALSNGIRAVISRPRFGDAAFNVPEGDKEIRLHIKY
jgi:uncharacterized protein (DUF2141 family)